MWWWQHVFLRGARHAMKNLNRKHSPKNLPWFKQAVSCRMDYSIGPISCTCGKGSRLGAGTSMRGMRTLQVGRGEFLHKLVGNLVVCGAPLGLHLLAHLHAPPSSGEYHADCCALHADNPHVGSELSQSKRAPTFMLKWRSPLPCCRPPPVPPKALSLPPLLMPRAAALPNVEHRHV